MFEKYLDRYHSKIFAIDEQENTYTYGFLKEQSDLVKDCFRDETALAIILCNNSFPSLVAYVSTLCHSKVVPILLPASINQEILSTFIRAYRPNFILDTKDRETVPYGYIKKSVVGSLKIYKSISLFEHCFYDKLALLMPTSGSTGDPKLVRLSYDNLLNNAMSIVRYLEINELDRPIMTLPMNYAYGLSIINSHMICGATIILNNYSITQNDFWRLVSSTRATTFGGVPFTYKMLSRLNLEQYELPSLRYLTQAGGKLSGNLVEKFGELCSRLGVKFYVMYGQTEATSRMSYLPPEQCLNKPSSIGIAIPGGKLYICDEEGNEIIDNDVEGELVYEGKNVSLGYALSPNDFKKSDERNGILHTGDIAKRDDAGYFYISGRKSRLVKVAGVRLGLDEIEAYCLEHDISLACLGKDDAIHIYVENCDTKSVKFVMSKMGIHHLYYKVYEIDEIPRNESGKIRYSALNDSGMREVFI